MSIKDENRLLFNMAARFAACLWDFHGTCPECGNNEKQHLPACRQTYSKEFNGPQDTERVFTLAFKIEPYNEIVGAGETASRHSAKACSDAFEWLRHEATKDGAPPQAGVALDEWNALTTCYVGMRGTS